jgi:hypothetical protein
LERSAGVCARVNKRSSTYKNAATATLNLTRWNKHNYCFRRRRSLITYKPLLPHIAQP